MLRRTDIRLTQQRVTHVIFAGAREEGKDSVEDKSPHSFGLPYGRG